MRAFFSDFLERIIQIARELPGNAKQLFTAWLGSLSALQLLLGAVILLFVVILILDNHRFVVRRYRVRTDKIRKNMTLVFLTDQHAKVYGEDNEKVIRRIREAGRGKLDFTVGSALDLFGGKLRLEDVLQQCDRR